jgi:hypothetical protein
MILFAISNSIETVMPVMVMSSRIFCCFCHTVIVIGSWPVMVMVKSNLIELIFFPRPRISISELVVPVEVVVAVVISVVDVEEELVVTLVDDDAVVFVVVALVDEEDWVEPPVQAVNNNESEIKRQTNITRDLVFMRDFSLY